VKGKKRKASIEEDIDSYRHEADIRKNAVPVGLASYDTSKPKPKKYDCDPHLDPVRKQATQIPLIRDKSLTEFMSGGGKYFCEGLQVLPKLSNGVDPQLIWSGKKEHASFEIPTASFHIYERIEPEAIIRSTKRGINERAY
jgi:hypothetical protein